MNEKVIEIETKIKTFHRLKYILISHFVHFTD